MISTTPPPEKGGEPGLSSHLLAFLASGMGYFRARMELAGIEGKEAAALYLKVAVLLVAGLLLFAFGYAFLWIGVVALAASVFHIHWGWVALGAAVLHGVGVAGCALGVRALWKTEVFTATMDEFRKDQAWLNRHT